MSTTGTLGGTQELRDALHSAWRRSDELFALLRDEAWLERPIGLRHPFLFYLGHLPAFAWNQVARGVLGLESFAPELDELFERGIDPLSDEAAAEATIAEWPDLATVLGYRDRVRELVGGELLERVAALGAADPLARELRVHRLVLEHELMHHETLVYMLQELSPRFLSLEGIPAPRLGRGPAGEPARVAIPGGEVTLGTTLDEVPFAWDNELARTRVAVADFALDELPVTNARFLAFVEAGGYREERWWTPEDRAWARAQRLTRPPLWTQRDDGRTCVPALGAPVPLEDAASWPAQVSHAEAAAFARWRGARLATEAELHRAAFGTPSGAERPYAWGDAEPDGQGAFGFVVTSPEPIGARPAGASAFGVHELVGNGWEWTATPFGPLPGFEPWMRTYPGYSADFFDGEHYVVFGASWATDEQLLRPSFRNWYQGHYPYPITKFRLAWSV